jgi:hypothetical protein
MNSINIHECNFWPISHWLREVKLVESLQYNMRDSVFDSQQGPSNFTATCSFCLYSVALRYTQPDRNEYLGT